MNVKVIRLTSGEDIVTSLVEENDDNIVIQDAIVAVPAGGGQLGFAPWAPLLRNDVKELTVSKKFVIYIADVNDELVEQYEEMFSLIKSPSKKLVL